MSDNPLDLLLQEVKDLYKAELDRYGQLYNRMGIFFAVFAVYANALVWFFQNGLSAERANVVLVVASVVLCGFTFTGFGHLLLALWGNTVSAVQGPKFWQERRDALRQPVLTQFALEGVASPTEVQVENRVATALKEDLADDYSRCAELNMNLNERRFGYLHRASQYAGLAFVAFLIAAGTHVYTVWNEAPASSALVRVQVVDPVRVNLNAGR